MSRTRDLGLFLLIAVLFGTSFPAIKAGLEYLPPLLFAAVRYYLSGLVVLVYAVGFSDRWRPATRNDWVGIIAGGTLFIGATGLTFVGQQYTTSGVAAILISLIPILTAVFAWWLLPAERLTARGAVGVLIGFVGVAVVVSPDPGDLLAAEFVGRTLIAFAAISIALGTVLVRRSHPPMSVVALTGWSMLLGATIQLAFAMAVGESAAAIRPTPTALALVAYLAVFSSGIGFVVYFHLLERFDALEVNLVTYLNPVVAVATGWLVLGEPLLPAAILGFGVIVLGFLVLTESEIAAELAVYRGAGR
ncbi:DMT family transporter [Natrononativus amylolyticus]|uniref:DMT family transporter n=1 Tax=Natrononativus amylolyticus TaxID=2963434 RepID=UPI0020CF8497|nr:EamA family transporter [Natrononativus amylolyticus]